MADERNYDLFIVGGGINGTAIAADAAGRGLSVFLAEMNDLASGTSSASSKLIHGGLRYLESYEFRLVREALAEREVLLKRAPHLIRPLRFVLPYVPGLRPRWMIRAGLFLYDHLSQRRAIPGSNAIDLRRDPAGVPLADGLTDGFDYWDCWVDDARLVVATAVAARELGATVVTRTKVVAARADGDWRLTIEDGAGRREVRARSLVNAAGPWVDAIDRMSARSARITNQPHLRLVKGSHLVLPRIDGANDAYLLQSPDKRVVFVLPLEQRFTIIGTTDVNFDGDPATVAASTEEERYLLQLAGQFFKVPLRNEDVIWRYSGVRPLYSDSHDNPAQVTRDYHLTLEATDGAPPRLSVYGGKVTTHRRLAEEVLEMLAPYFGSRMSHSWTARASLPGGDMPNGDFAAFLSGLCRKYPGLDAGYLGEVARRHGTRAGTVLGDARAVDDLGRDLGHGLFEREVTYFKASEWAREPNDVLWRRTKIGLYALAQSEKNLAAMGDEVGKLL